MKTIKYLKGTLIIALMLVFIYSCNNNNDDDDDDNNTPTKTSYELISENPELSTFKAAVDKIDDIKVILNIEGGNDFTAFAPDNAAFDQLLGVLGYSSIDDMPISDLTNYMANHIVQGKVEGDMMREEETGYIVTLLNISPGKDVSMFFNASGSDIILNGTAKVSDADNESTNGVVHVVDNIIVIPTLSTFMETDPRFSTMREALQIIEDEEGSTINAQLTAAPTYTVFVPTNEGFNSFYEEHSLESLADLNSSQIEDVLNVHVINSNVRGSDIKAAEGGPGINTSTDVLTVHEDGDGNYYLTDPQGRDANIIKLDVRAVNGYIHIIDGVLLGS